MVGIGLSLVWVSHSWAQLAVIDAANLSRNTVTSFQSTITAIESVLQSGYMVLELEPFGDTGLNGEFWTTLGELEAILGEGQHVIWDIESLTRQLTVLFGLEGAPDSAEGLRMRLYEIRRYKQTVLFYTSRVLTLQRRAIHTIAHIESLVARIVDFIGGKQARQNISAQLSTITAEETRQAVLTAAYQQAMLTDKHEMNMIDESMERINEALMADYPSGR
jgi:hypothetical protein